MQSLPNSLWQSIVIMVVVAIVSTGRLTMTEIILIGLGSVLIFAIKDWLAMQSYFRDFFGVRGTLAPVPPSRLVPKQVRFNRKVQVFNQNGDLSQESLPTSYDD